MAIETAWAGFYSIGLPRDTSYKPADKQGLLVWGGASSVGSAVVQCGRIMGFRVYVAASAKHTDYLKSLGASQVFDYRDENVVANIVKAARDDGVVVSTGYDAVGQLKFSMDVLRQAKADGTAAKVASAVPLSDESPEVEGVEARFVDAPHDEKERDEHFQFVFTNWLKEKLEKGEFLPSPKVKVIEGGLEGINKGLEELKGGVSGVKLAVEI